MKLTKLFEDGEGGGGGGDAGMSVGMDGGAVGNIDTGMNITDILAGGSGDQNKLGVLGVGNFNFPYRIGQIKKRLLAEYKVPFKKKQVKE